MTGQDRAVLALKGREATAKELGESRETLRRCVKKDLVRISGQRPSSSSRPMNVYRLTRSGATLARKLERAST